MNVRGREHTSTERYRLQWGARKAEPQGREVDERGRVE
jgi:hypothetical protein